MTKKRDPVKFVRDKAKSRYEKGSECEICLTNENLEFHHYYSLTPLFNKWLKENGIVIETDEDVVAVRDAFIEQHHNELYNETVTLCKTHHLALHAIYGKDPILTSSSKQKRWVGIQREKHERTKLGT